MIFLLQIPGGNTYFNQLSFYNFNSIEIIKGPASSLYGAGIGGAMLIHTLPANGMRELRLVIRAGSFNTHSINTNVKTGRRRPGEQFQFFSSNKRWLSATGKNAQRYCYLGKLIESK